MRVVDLSHLLEEGMSIFPGDIAPVFAGVGDIALGDPSRITNITMNTHTGTHIDCSAHVISDGLTADMQEAACFMGRGVVIDCSEVEAGDEIPLELIKKHDLSKFEFVLLYCGFSEYWNTPGFFSEYPMLSYDALEYLIKQEGIRGLGVEYISLDPISSEDLPRHKAWLGSNAQRCIIENLTNLRQLIGESFTLLALPLKIKNGEGSPVRAIAITE